MPSVPNAGTDYMVRAPAPKRGRPGVKTRFRFGGIAQNVLPPFVGTLQAVDFVTNATRNYITR